MKQLDNTAILDRVAAKLRELPVDRQARFLAELETDPAPWIGAKTAARLLGCCTDTVVRLAETGRLTVRRLPAGHPRYLRDEVLALADASTKPAVAQP